MNKNQFYTYRQGTAHYREPLRIESSNNGCMSALIGAMTWAVVGTVTALLVYFGYKLLVHPLITHWWMTLTTALGG